MLRLIFLISGDTSQTAKPLKKKFDSGYKVLSNIKNGSGSGSGSGFGSLA